MSRIPLTFLAPVYNEAGRIRNLIEHALQWADAIIIADKGSTDGTLNICREYGNRVRVCPIPYSERGHEDMTTFPELTSTEWIFLGTCSEIPTRKLIESCRALLDREGNQIDLVYIPRRMYFFGEHLSIDNWGVCHYPFLIHRERTIVTNQIHDNFHAADPSRTRRISYSEECCVYHFTHPTVQSFWNSSGVYFGVEARETKDREKAIRQCFKNIDRLSSRILREGQNWLPFYCALASYELGKALSLWEASRGVKSAAPYYADMTRHLLATEWQVGNPQAEVAPKVSDPIHRSRLPETLRPMIELSSRLPYLFFKVIYGFKRLLGKKK